MKRTAPKRGGESRNKDMSEKEKALAENRLELTDVMVDNLEKLAGMYGMSVGFLE